MFLLLMHPQETAGGGFCRLLCIRMKLPGKGVNIMQGKGVKLIANNKKAYHDYFVEEKYEAGLALHGTEVKSVRMGKCSIKEAFAKIEDGEMWVYGMNISPYEKGNIFNRDPLRPKKLLLHKYEINKIAGNIATQGYTLIPLQVYLKDSLVKIEIGLCRGKKLYDKRHDIAKKDQQREAQKEFKIRNLGQKLTKQRTLSEQTVTRFFAQQVPAWLNSYQNMETRISKLKQELLDKTCIYYI